MRNRKLIIIAVLAALALTVSLAVRLLRSGGTQPNEAALPAAAIRATTHTLSFAAEETGEKTRRAGVYTFLLAGQDGGNGNTDTLMVLRLDTAARRVDAVSIPRDTMINAAWQIHKINAAYSMGLWSGEGGPETLCRYVEGLTGFPVDGYAVVDIGCFEQAVDAMGGVYFTVPMAMDYEDPSQDLSIHLQPGYQRLSGSQALGLCRFRSGYATADLGRIEMQQRFLKACASQLIQLGSVPNAVKVVQTLADNLETDLNAGTIAWLLAQGLRCQSEDIHFYTAPNQLGTAGGYSYTVLELEPWLELLNACLNPYTSPLTAEDLDVVYLENGVLRCTGQREF